MTEQNEKGYTTVYEQVGSLMRIDRYRELLLKEPFMCECGREMIKFKGLEVCLLCQQEAEANKLTEVKKKVINAGTDFAGIDWQQLERGQNGRHAAKIRDIVKKDYFNIVIYGPNKGVGKTNTAMVIRWYFIKDKKNVVIGLQSELSRKMVEEGKEKVYERLKSCDLLIVDEIGRGMGELSHYGDRLYFKTLWYEIIDKRKDNLLSTILIGNMHGVSRPKDIDTNGYHFADDYFDNDRLRAFDAFEYKGQTYRGAIK